MHESLRMKQHCWDFFKGLTFAVYEFWQLKNTIIYFLHPCRVTLRIGLMCLGDVSA